MAPNDPAGPLQSDLLSGNERLQKCAELDFFHVQPDEPAAEHVRLIQEALRQIDKADIPLSETTYGDNTTKAVVAFKTKHDLFTRGTRSIDPIVGIRTIGKLDEFMQIIEARRRGGGVDPPKVDPNKKVPRLALSGQCQVIGEFKDDPSAGDMQFADPIAARKSAATTLITAPFVSMSDDALEDIMVTAISAAVIIAGGTSGGIAVRAQAIALCNHFFRGGGRERNFKKGSNVSIEAQTDVGFLNFVSKIRFSLDKAIRTVWKSGVLDDRLVAGIMRATMDSPRFGTGQFSGALAAFIGGFQGYHVEMCGLTADTAAETFTYNLDIEIFDHFGVDETDINRGGGGLGVGIGASMASFFVLQHDRSALPGNFLLRKYRPFRLTMRTDMGPFTGKVF